MGVLFPFVSDMRHKLLNLSSVRHSTNLQFTNKGFSVGWNCQGNTLHFIAHISLLVLTFLGTAVNISCFNQNQGVHPQQNVQTTLKDCRIFPERSIRQKLLRAIFPSSPSLSIVEDLPARMQSALTTYASSPDRSTHLAPNHLGSLNPHRQLLTKISILDPPLHFSTHTQ